MRIRAPLLGWLIAVCACGFAGALYNTPSELKVQPPILRSIFPLGGQAGETATVQFTGDFPQQGETPAGSECDSVSGTNDFNRCGAGVEILANVEGAAGGRRQVQLEDQNNDGLDHWPGVLPC